MFAMTLERVSRGRVWSIAVLASLVAPRVGVAQAPPPFDRLAIDRLVDSVLREFQAPGLSLAIVRDTSVVVLQGYGQARLRPNVAVDAARTAFRLGSVAKIFVATAAMQQVESGRLALDGDIAQYLGDLPLPRWQNHGLTLRQLLTHTAGFEERIIGYAARTEADREPLGAHLARRLPARLWAPGTRFGYSNYGFGLAAYLVEKVAGQPYSDYAADHLFRPLGMNRTAYLAAAPDTDPAEGYRCGESGCVAVPTLVSNVYPVGLVSSTAADMARFLVAMLDGGAAGGGRILDSASVAAMEARQFTHHPALDGVGLGWFRSHRAGYQIVAHPGSLPGFTSLLLMVPAERCGVFFVANASAAGLATALSAALVDGLLPPRPDPVGPPPADRTAPIGGAAGIYLGARRPMTTIERFPGLFAVDKLSVAVEGQDLVVGFPTGTDARFRSIDREIFQEVGGSRKLAVARRPRSDVVEWIYVGQPAFGAELPGAFERLAWHDEPHFMNEYVSYLVMLPLLGLLLIWPMIRGIRAIVERRRSIAGPRVFTRPALPAIVAGFGYVVLFPLFGFGFVAASNRQLASLGDIVFGLPTELARWRRIPYVVAGLVVFMIFQSALLWRSRRWSGSDRVVYTLWTLLGVAGLVFLIRWNYLPPRY